VSRLADIPGVGYGGMDSALRRRLPEHDAVPTVHRYSGTESLWWGSDSRSPAHRHQLEDENVSTARLLQNLSETLDLPGTPGDYHFAIQGAISHLLSRRMQEPTVLDEVERLCLLNIALVEARPDAVAVDLGGDISGGFVEMHCFPTLITLYEEEGALPEGRGIAERAGKFGKCADALERLSQKEAAVLAEDEP
jgi:hypothetical protein